MNPDRARASHNPVLVKSGTLVATAVLLVVVPLISVAFGAAFIPLRDTFMVVFSHLPGIGIEVTWDPITEAIIWDNRMPRVMAGLGIGAILGVSGAAFQAVVRNPLAEPYILGVSSGASLGAAAAIVLIGTVNTLGVASLAFAGALLVTLFVLGLGGGSGGSSLHLILAGLGAGFVCQAFTNLIMFSAKTAETAQAVVFWQLGSLTRAGWGQVGLLLLAAAALTVFLWVTGPILDALASGDETCIAVGLNPALARVVILGPVSAAVAIAVSISGGIGFIGLMVPHLLRPIVGHAHRWLVVACAMAGALFLTLTDTVSRTWFAPAEIPLSIITGMIGAPFLMVLIHRTRVRA